MPQQREDLSIEAPPQGWDFIYFIDFYSAQIVGGTSFIENGKEKVKLLLFVANNNALLKRYKISKDRLTPKGCIEVTYPKEMIKTLNEDDPARKIRFCMLTFEGKPTPATEWFLGYEQNKKIEKLREINEGLRVHNATLKQENLMIQNNIQKYIKTHISDVLPSIIPIMQLQREREDENLRTRELQRRELR